MREGVLYCDGSPSGNPGESGIGAVLLLEGKTYEISEHIGMATNNIAEYTALIKGLSRAQALKTESLKIFLDSELIVKQIQGSYKVKSENLKSLYQEALSHLKFFKAYTISHISREQNKRADSLAKKAAALPVQRQTGKTSH